MSTGEMDSYRKLVQENIDYDFPLSGHPYGTETLGAMWSLWWRSTVPGVTSSVSPEMRSPQLINIGNAS